MFKDNHAFVPINDSGVNSGIDADDNKSNYDENEEDGDEENVNNNDATLYNEDGVIIINYGLIEYDEFNIPITVVHFSMVESHAVFGFFRQLSRSFKKCRDKLGIMCVLFSKSLYGTNYHQCTWVKCARVITNKNNHLICHLEKKHYGVSSVKALLSNKKKKGMMASVPATVQSIGSSPNTRVPSSISVTMNKYSVELVKRDVFF